jgi:hypothetical protein
MANVNVPAAYPYPEPLPTTGDTPNFTIKFTGCANTTSYAEDRPAIWDVFVGGGYRSVGPLTERNSIADGVRKEGMLVWVKDTGHMYQLQADFVTWTDLGDPSTWGSGGGGTPSDTTPLETGVGAAGALTTYSRGDHVHALGDISTAYPPQILARLNLAILL